MEPELLEGKLEALPRADDELGWADIWMYCLIGALGLYSFMLVTHFFILLHRHAG